MNRQEKELVRKKEKLQHFVKWIDSRTESELEEGVQFNKSELKFIADRLREYLRLNESMKKAVKTYAQKVSMAAMGENVELRVSRICNLMYNEYIKGQRDFAKKLLEKLDDKTKGYDDEFYKGYDTGVDDSIAIIEKMMKGIDEMEATPYPGEGSMWK